VSTFVAFGALAAGYYTRPAPTMAHVNSVVLAAWVSILLLSGILGLISAATARRYENTSLLLERVALIGSGPFCLVYAILIAVLRGWGGWSGVLIFTMFAVASGWRLYQVQRVVHWRKRRGKALLA
jgi:hypothetical protein